MRRRKTQNSNLFAIDFDAIENVLQKKAIRNYMPIQKGDVPETWSDTSLLDTLIDYHPETDFKEGITKFIEWYKDYYKI